VPCAHALAQRVEQALLADPQPLICHGGEVDALERPADRRAPASPDPGSDCPGCLICCGHGSALFALPAPPNLSGFNEVSSVFSPPASDAAILASPVWAPRSRGPPRTL
jgi:hypothetical protein